MSSPALRTRRGMAALLVVAATLAGCSDGSDDAAAPDPSATPSPTSGATPDPGRDLPDVAVVLPARNTRPEAEIEVQRQHVEEVAAAARAADQVDEVRIVLPDRFSTIGDVLTVLAEEGYDLVCALGPGAARGLREVASRFPETKFCATPGRLPEVGRNSLVFDLRVEEAAYLAGIAARFAAPGSSSEAGRDPALVFGDPAQAPRLIAPFDEGFLSVRPDAPSAAALVATDEATARAAAASQFQAGAFFVYTSAGRPEIGVVQAAIDAGRLVVGWDAWLGPLVPDVPEETPTDPPADEATPSGSPLPSASPSPAASPASLAPWNVMLFEENLATALRDAITELVDGWTGGGRSLGFANGALLVVPGVSPAWARVRTQVLSTQEAIIRGDIVVEAG